MCPFGIGELLNKSKDWNYSVIIAVVLFWIYTLFLDLINLI